MPRRYNEKRLTFKDVSSAAERFSNWGKWGLDDEIGTLNFVAERYRECVQARAARKAFFTRPEFRSQRPAARFMGEPIQSHSHHADYRYGCDVWPAKRRGYPRRRRAVQFVYSQKTMISMPLQCGTQWDGLSHIFYRGKMWNGYDARLVDSDGAQRNGIEKVKAKMAGRGVLLDVARYLDQEYLEDGTAITMADLDATAAAQEIEVRRGDFVIVRTGQMEQRLKVGEWGGYAGGEAPGLAFETCEWIYNKQIAAICTDTWGCEVRPPETVDVESPWHWVVIPKIGISMGERYVLSEGTRRLLR